MEASGQEYVWTSRRCWHSAASAFRQPSVLRYRLNTYGRRAFQLPAPQSGTLSRISSGTRPSVRTVSDSCLKRTCSLDTSAFSALEVLTTTALYKSTYLLTYLLIPLPKKCVWPLCGLDLWPLTLVTFTAILTYMANIYAEFDCNFSSKWREIAHYEK